MELNDNDKKLLEMIGVTDATDEEKQTILTEIDQKMSERFIANLLNTMDAESAKKLQEELDSVPNDDPEKVISKIVTTHPDAAAILEKTSREVMEEFKKAHEVKVASQAASVATLGQELDAKPPIEEAAPKEPDVASGTLVETSTSELDKNIAELQDESAPEEPIQAPEPPTAPSQPAIEDSASETDKGVFLPPSDEALQPPASQDDGPLNVSFSQNNMPSNNAIEHKQEETAEAAPASMPISETIVEPEKPFEDTAPTMVTNLVQDTAPAVTPEASASPSPTDNPAPWSFSSPAPQTSEPAPALQTSPETQQAPAEPTQPATPAIDQSPAIPPAPLATPAFDQTAPATDQMPTANPTDQSAQTQPPTSISDLYK